MFTVSQNEKFDSSVCPQRPRFQKFYLLLLVCSLVWCALIISFPWLVRAGHLKTAAAIFFYFSHLCHQLPQRSFAWLGIRLPVCVRCLGVYLGWLLGVLLYPALRLWPRQPLRLVFFLCALSLMGLDVGLNWMGLIGNTIYSRSLSGGLLGVSLSLLLLGIIENGLKQTALEKKG